VAFTILRKIMKSSPKIIALFITITVLLSSCSPFVTKKIAEKELAAFMVDFIIQQEIGGTSDYIQTSGQPWVVAPPKANIIIWAPPIDETGENSFRHINDDDPIKVWIFVDNKLVESTDKTRTINEYYETYISNPKSNIWAWGHYDFGILSYSKLNYEANIYVGASCGPICGHGVIYTLRRNIVGKWKIIDVQDLWVS
jgi:hypothetical protein